MLTIGQAFEVAYQKMMKARAKLTASAFEKTLEQVMYYDDVRSMHHVILYTGSTSTPSRKGSIIEAIETE